MYPDKEPCTRDSLNKNISHADHRLTYIYIFQMFSVWLLFRQSDLDKRALHRGKSQKDVSSLKVLKVIRILIFAVVYNCSLRFDTRVIFVPSAIVYISLFLKVIFSDWSEQSYVK